MSNFALHGVPRGFSWSALGGLTLTSSLAFFSDSSRVNAIHFLPFLIFEGMALRFMVYTNFDITASIRLPPILERGDTADGSSPTGAFGDFSVSTFSEGIVSKLTSTDNNDP